MRNPRHSFTVSRETFLRYLGETGLFPEDELPQILSDLSAATVGPDGAVLAQQLVIAGKLTNFQAQAILDRRLDDILLGNYLVLNRLGEGGMGQVFKARHRLMKRVVAIKFLARQVAHDPMFVRRFQREVEAVARLSHPNIVMAFDADEAPAGPFLVMEFVDGEDLDSQVRQRGPLTLSAAVDCVSQAARGLAYAHGQGIIHRDVKPANLLQDAAGVVKVTDLGLARFNESLGQSSRAGLTQSGVVVGTVEYMAPEQAEDSSTIDHRADIYSLGCTLFFLLTGRPPFVGQTLLATMILHRDATIPALCQVRPEAPPALDELLRHMLAKKTEDRIASMAEVAQALETVKTTLQSSAPAPLGQAAALPVAATGPWSEPFGNRPTRMVAGPAANAYIMGGWSEPSPASTPQSVLLVEPSRTQASIVRNYLKDMGVPTVQTATSGQTALDILRTAPMQAVVSAMRLDGLSGAQLAHGIRAEPQLANTCIVVISSATDSAEARELRGLPGTVLLPKPFDGMALAHALRQARLSLLAEPPRCR